jgi:serine protease
MSLGGSGSCSGDDETATAIANAISRGTSVVVAAGNSNDDSAYYSPASCPGVVTVASTGVTGKRAFYSNYGSGITLAAPGGGIYKNDASSGEQANPEGFIWAAANRGTTTPTTIEDGGSIYGGMAGTSQAAPHVTAAVALMISALEDQGLGTRSPAQIKAMLASSARPYAFSQDRPLGSGILNVHAAVSAMLGVDLPPQYTALTAGQLLSAQRGAAGQSVMYSIVVPAGAKNLSLRSMGGTGDVNMYVKASEIPAANGSDADFASVHAGNAEVVLVPKPQATTYFIRLVATKDFANLSILATYTAP